MRDSLLPSSQRAVRPRLKGLVAVASLAIAATVAEGQFVDPPHSDVLLPDAPCLACHTPHHAEGTAIIKAQSVPLLCQSCHRDAGQASNRPLNEGDQAFPGLSGTSHRWDSGPSGHVEPEATNTSPGLMRSGGAFTGRIERTYTITITASGDAGAATFDWTDSEGGGGSGVSGAAVPLDAGLDLTFVDAPTSPSFVTGDRWTLYVRTDLRAPDPGIAFEADMANRFQRSAEKVVCTVCHNQHWQNNQPFDSNAPPFGGAGTGWTATGLGRHYQRVPNDTNQMCTTCHSVRDVTSSAEGSHPVGIPIPADPIFQSPPDLPLDAGGNLRCMTCHAPHFFPGGNPATTGSSDGYILRRAIGDLCYQCHSAQDFADRAGGSHFDPTSGLLWPGGQYGSSFPAHSVEKRGFCVNCHWPHGWPDDASPADDYPRLWVERYDTASDGSDADDAEDLCFTCHDGAPATTDIRGEFAKGTNGASIFHHPVVDSEQTPGRSVECVDCHNPHRARSDNRHAGATGVDLAGAPVGPGTANDRDVTEPEVCFKCHGDTFNAARPETSNKRLDFQTTNSAFHPVAGPGQNQSANLTSQLLGGLTTSSTIRCTDCHNNQATADAVGPASRSTASPKGPHGSTNAAIRRANYRATYLANQGPTTYSRNDFQLCFLCHDPARLVEARRFDDNPPARTNFFDDIDGRDNLHEVHLVDRIDKSRATCKNCHFNVHSNRTAANTQYNVDGTVFTSPPPGFKTHLVNFSPDVLPTGGRARPEWRIDTATRQRQCFLSCHGAVMSFVYRPPSGDDSPTIP